MWLIIAWRWLKKYWMWLLFPIGLLLYLLGRLSSRNPSDVVAPEVVGAEEERRRAREEADRKEFEAARDRERKLDEIREEHADVVKELTDTQRAMAKDLEEDPEKLNEFLLSVGRQVRGDDA